MNKKVLSNFALFFTALIWGVSFVAQKAGMDYVGPFSFNFIRCILGGLSLLPLIFLLKISHPEPRSSRLVHKKRIFLLKAGLSCGLALFTAMTIQQYSMISASAGKAGFISALYIIFVPLIMSLFGQKISNTIKVSIGMALVGLYLLCFKSGSGFDFYDILLLISAFFYGVHILVVNYFSRHIDAIKVSCFQFFVVGILSSILMLIFEEPTLQGFIDCKVPILYAGILTCGVAYTLQIFGQKYTAPTVASLIFCLESVFAVVGGSLILHESMTLKEIFGCVFMISAVVLSQVQFNFIKKVPSQLSPPEVEQILDSDL
ncbi:DMT family transporter [bacterium]|nr:DMT family transporter [bacterium]